MESPAIVIEHFSKRFGKRLAVEDLSLQVPRGSIFGFLGQNGAGKTTTIRTLLNLLQPTSGRLQVLGHDSMAESVPPEKAFYRVLVWDKGTFDLLPKVERAFPTEIQSSIEGLLMEGMRQLDEMTRLGDALPSLQSTVSVASPMDKPLRDATPEELDVIQLALDHATLVDMMNHSGKPDPEVAEAVVALLEKGYLASK